MWQSQGGAPNENHGDVEGRRGGAGALLAGDGREVISHQCSYDPFRLNA